MKCCICQADVSSVDVSLGTHNRNGREHCAKCYHNLGTTIRVPTWVADEIVCLLGLADGVSDLARRCSKETGCECDIESVCLACHARNVAQRSSKVIDWLVAAGVKRRGA